MTISSIWATRCLSNVRPAKRSALIASFALLIACQSSGTVPEQSASLRQSSESDATKATCSRDTFGIDPPDATIKRRQKRLLLAILTHWGYYRGQCQHFSAGIPATWQSSGGHLSRTYGSGVDFWARQTGSYTINAEAVHEGTTYYGSAMITVQ